jgi:hypothetical protein
MLTTLARSPLLNQIERGKAFKHSCSGVLRMYHCCLWWGHLSCCGCAEAACAHVRLRRGLQGLGPRSSHVACHACTFQELVCPVIACGGREPKRLMPHQITASGSCTESSRARFSDLHVLVAAGTPGRCAQGQRPLTGCVKVMDCRLSLWHEDLVSSCAPWPHDGPVLEHGSWMSPSRPPARGC